VLAISGAAQNWVGWVYGRLGASPFPDHWLQIMSPNQDVPYFELILVQWDEVLSLCTFYVLASKCTLFDSKAHGLCVIYMMEREKKR